MVYIAAPEKLGNILKTNLLATSLSPSHLLILKIWTEELKSVTIAHTHPVLLGLQMLFSYWENMQDRFFILSTDESDQRHRLER